MSFDITVRDRIDASIATKLQAIKTQSQEGVRAITQMRTLLGSLGKSTGLGGFNQGLITLRSNMSGVNRQVVTFDQGFRRALITANRLLSGVFLLRAAKNLTESLDQFRVLENKLRDVSTVRGQNGIVDAIKSQERLNELTRQLFDVANNARVAVGDLAKTYRRFDVAVRAAGGSQQESMRITETASKLLSLSGATTNEAASAMLQLSQAFNKGKLDGDEFRSVAELMPEIIDAITKRLGISRAEIFDYSRAGKINLEVLRGAFSDLATSVDEQFAKLPKTIDQSLTIIGNKLIQLFGQFDKSYQFTDRFTQFIDHSIEHLPTLINLSKSFIAIWTAQKLVAGVQYLRSILATMISLGLAFNVVGTAVVAFIGYFTFFANEIKITADGVVTLQDLMIALFQVVRDFVIESGGGILSQLFNPDTATEAINGVSRVASFVFDIFKSLAASGYALYDTWKSLSWGDIWTILIETAETAVALLKNMFIELFKQISIGFEKAMNAVSKLIFDTLLKILDKVGALASTIPFVGQGISEFARGMASELRQMGPAIADLGLDDWWESQKTNLATMAPFTQKVLNEAADKYKENYDLITQTSREFYDTLLNIARNNATARIAEEERVRKAMEPNEDALRGVEKAAKKSKVTIVGNGPVDDFPIQVFGNAKRIYERKKGLEDTKTAIDKVTEAVKKTSTTSKSASLSTVQDFDKMNDAVLALEHNLSYISFTAAENSARSFAGVATAALDAVGNKSIQVGYEITVSQTNAWYNATNAVLTYAQTAINSLNSVAVASGASRGVVSSLTLGNGITGPTKTFTGRFGSFASGGYTGNADRGQIAGVVHGQEYVMPASQTARYRSELEAMKSGSYSGGINVTIENYGNSTHTVEQISANEIRIIAREEANTTIARNLGNANSAVSKSVKANLATKRKR